MRPNLGMLEGQSETMPSDEAFPSLSPPHTQYNDVDVPGHGQDDMDLEMELLKYLSDDHLPTDQHDPPQLQQSPRFSASLMNQPQQQFHQEESMLLQQRQQQEERQRFLKWKRYFSVDAAAAQINQMQQQKKRLVEMQQYQDSLRALHQQRHQMQQPHHSPNLPMIPPKGPVPLQMCERRITQYMMYQKRRPRDNNIEFWREFVQQFFAPGGKKVWCVSMYGKLPLTSGVSPQNEWQCKMCQRKPGRGFEASYDILARLFKIKYDSGIVEELLYIDTPHGYYSPLGNIVVTYSTAVQQTLYEQLRVVRYGQLRILFSLDLKIRSWEFCAVKHEESVPRRLLTSQMRHLANAVQKYQASIQNKTPSSKLSTSDLESSCAMFMESARGRAKTVQEPLLNELGYSKRYIQCLQIAEVVNRMKGVIDFSQITGASPLESLAMLRGRPNTTTSSRQNQDPEEGQRRQQQQQWQQAQTSNGVATVNNHDYPLQNVWKPAS